MEQNHIYNRSVSLFSRNLQKALASNDDNLSLVVTTGQEIQLQHRMMAKKQRIVITIEQGAICVLQSSDLVDIVDASEIELVVYVQASAQFTFFFSSLYAMHSTYTISVYLQGDNAQAFIYGLYALDQHQKISLKTYQYHIGMDTKSELVVKGMLKDKAQVSYHGLIKIDEQAKKTDASQEHKNIVLSKDAKVISIPSIEVLEHDVQCCHGSAIGKFDAEHLWYLQSKGINSKKAHELLIRSFFQDVVSNVNQKEKLEKHICQKMV